jgi:hypothetical protein
VCRQYRPKHNELEKIGKIRYSDKSPTSSVYFKKAKISEKGDAGKQAVFTACVLGHYPKFLEELSLNEFCGNR